MGTLGGSRTPAREEEGGGRREEGGGREGSVCIVMSHDTTV